MLQAQVLGVWDVRPGMTYADGLAYVNRARRQLERFDVLPHSPGQKISDEDAAAIRALCDALETSMNAFLTAP